jgi:hypothetical protein
LFVEQRSLHGIVICPLRVIMEADPRGRKSFVPTREVVYEIVKFSPLLKFSTIPLVLTVPTYHV